ETMAQASVRGARGNSGMILHRADGALTYPPGSWGRAHGAAAARRFDRDTHYGRSPKGSYPYRRPRCSLQVGEHLGHARVDESRRHAGQHQALQARRPIAFVSDTACDLPDELVLQYDIGLVPMQLIVDDRAYRDRLELTPGEFFRRLRTGHDASTSQPAPQAFADAYKDAARAADQVIAVVVSSALSGTH